MVLEHGVDCACTQHVVQNHCSAADYAGLVGVGGWQYLQFAGGEGGRVAVHGFAQTSHEDVVGLGHVSGDDQRFGVEQVDRTREYLADVAPTFPDQPPGFGVAAEREADEVADVSHAVALLLHGAYQCPTSRDGLEAPGVAASAGDSRGSRNLGVPEFACAAYGSPLEHAAGDD